MRSIMASTAKSYVFFFFKKLHITVISWAVDNYEINLDLADMYHETVESNDCGTHVHM
jgi:hypothetical protein